MVEGRSLVWRVEDRPLEEGYGHSLAPQPQTLNGSIMRTRYNRPVTSEIERQRRRRRFYGRVCVNSSSRLSCTSLDTGCAPRCVQAPVRRSCAAGRGKVACARPAQGATSAVVGNALAALGSRHPVALRGRHCSPASSIQGSVARTSYLKRFVFRTICFRRICLERHISGRGRPWSGIGCSWVTRLGREGERARSRPGRT